MERSPAVPFHSQNLMGHKCKLNWKMSKCVPTAKQMQLISDRIRGDCWVEERNPKSEHDVGFHYH